MLLAKISILGNSHCFFSMFRRCCEMEGKGPKSLSDLKTGMHIYGDKEESSKKEVFYITKPDWYDESKFKRGQEFFLVHRFSIIFSFLIALMVGLTVDELTDALMYTQCTVGPAKARKRYVHTLDYLIRWHNGGKTYWTQEVNVLCNEA